MSKQVADTLRRARGFIERGWCQGDFARDDYGGVSPDSPSAQVWCAMGAIKAVTEENADYDAAISALKAQADWSLAFWNDRPGRTQADVLAAFDRAIAAEEAAP